MCLSKHKAMSSYWGGVEIQLHAFFDLGTRCRCVLLFTVLGLRNIAVITKRVTKELLMIPLQSLRADRGIEAKNGRFVQPY